MIGRQHNHILLKFLLRLLLCNPVYSLLSTPSFRRVPPTSRLSQSIPLEIQDAQSEYARQSTIDQINLNKQLISYSFYWESLLNKEYQDTVAELQLRRKSYTRSQLESSGLSLFNAIATPETELYGEKIVRISLLNKSHKYDNGGGEKLREKFKRGDVLVMTPEILFRGKDIAPREGTLTCCTPYFINLHQLSIRDAYIAFLLCPKVL